MFVGFELTIAIFKIFILKPIVSSRVAMIWAGCCGLIQYHLRQYHFSFYITMCF